MNNTVPQCFGSHNAVGCGGCAVSISCKHVQRRDVPRCEKCGSLFWSESQKEGHYCPSATSRTATRKEVTPQGLRPPYPAGQI